MLDLGDRSAGKLAAAVNFFASLLFLCLVEDQRERSSVNYSAAENNDGDRGVMRIQGRPGGDARVSETFIKATERFNIQSTFILNGASFASLSPFLLIA